VVNLFYANSSLVFAEPGTYTLFTYAGTLGGDTALLSVGNRRPARAMFSPTTRSTPRDPHGHRRVGRRAAVWTDKDSGDWETGAHWSGGAAPDGDSVIPLFGLAITNATTVTLGAAHTVGGLLFNNNTYGYTLGGSGGLTFANAGAAATVSALAGSHTLNTALTLRMADRHGRRRRAIDARPRRGRRCALTLRRVRSNCRATPRSTARPPWPTRPCCARRHHQRRHRHPERHVLVRRGTGRHRARADDQSGRRHGFRRLNHGRR
jgi:hypothetical protein